MADSVAGRILRGNSRIVGNLGLLCWGGPCAYAVAAENEYLTLRQRLIATVRFVLLHEGQLVKRIKQ